MTASRARLNRKQMTAPALVVASISASCPLVVLNGSIPETFSSTQVAGVPLTFVTVGAVVWLLSIGYITMSQRVPHAAVYYAANARGLGRPLGVACGFIALLAYNTIQTSLYGFLGNILKDMFGIPWWLGGLIAVAIVGSLGVRKVVISTSVLTVVLGITAIMIALFLVAASNSTSFIARANEGFSPSRTFVSGFGGAATFCVAALLGFEIAASFSEEARSRTSVGRAVIISLISIVALYTLLSWATLGSIGMDRITDQNSNFPYALYASRYTDDVPAVARMALVLGVGTSLLALHSIAARYGFAMAREGVLSERIAWTGRDKFSNTPVGGSLLQSAFGFGVVLVFGISGADPMSTLFPWFSATGAIGLVTLLVTTSGAAIVFSRRDSGSGKESVWRSLIAPALSVVLGAVVLFYMMTNVSSLLHVSPGSITSIVIPLTPFLFGIVGLVWAIYLSRTRPDVYRAIGYGHSGRRAALNTQLAHLAV